MAVFMLNVCKFNGCGLTFKSLGHLIQHIEETHIDYDPHVVEQTELQQPTCIPLSYALRFLTDAARKEGLKPVSQGRLCRETGVNFATTTSATTTTTTMSTTTRSRNNAATPTGSEAEEGDEFVSEPEDSNDSWTTSEEFSADFILRYGGNRVINPGPATPTNNSNNNSTNNSNSSDKPFACPVPGCKKRYKNVNGIKYHSKNGHKNDGKIRKAFRCPCGKSYKTPYGLKNHASIQHAGTLLQIKLQQQNVKSSCASSSVKSEKHARETTSKTVTPLKIVKHAQTKTKIAAIEDHGYMKSDKQIYTETSSSTESTIQSRDDDDLGILTPASTPPLSSRSPGKNDTVHGNSQQQTSDSSLHKYLANVVTSNQLGQNRRDNVDNNNPY